MADRSLPGQLAAQDVDQPVDLGRTLILDEDLGQAGPRKSMSTSKVRSPARAHVPARLIAVVLLPSPAFALVTSKVVIGPRLSAIPSRLARMLR